MRLKQYKVTMQYNYNVRTPPSRLIEGGRVTPNEIRLRSNLSQRWPYRRSFQSRLIRFQVKQKLA